MLFYRLRWYALATGRMLHRRWQAIVLGGMLLSPAMMPVFAQSRVLGAPLLAPLAPAHGLIWRFAWLHGLEAAGMLWVLMQRSAITGGPFAAFLGSLPIPPRRRRVIDLAVMLIANTPLLLPACAAALVLSQSQQPGAHALYLLDVISITACVQLAILARTTRYVALILLSNLGLLCGLQTHAHTQVACFGASLLLALVLLVCASDNVGAPRARRSLAGTAQRSASHWAKRMPPMLRLSASILCRRYAVASLTRALLLTGIICAALVLMQIWQFDARARALLIIAQALMALVAAASYRDLAAAHAQAASYMAALPMRRITQPVCDIAMVLVLSLPFTALLPLVLVSRATLALAPALGDMLVVSCLLIVLRGPQVGSNSHGVVLSALLAGAWAICAWQLFV